MANSQKSKTYFEKLSEDCNKLFQAGGSEPVTLTITLTLRDKDRERGGAQEAYTLAITLSKEEIFTKGNNTEGGPRRRGSIMVGKRQIEFYGNSGNERLKFGDGMEYLVFQETKMEPFHGTQEELRKKYDKAKYIGMRWFPKIGERKTGGKTFQAQNNCPFVVSVTTANENRSKTDNAIAKRISGNWVIFDNGWRFPSPLPKKDNPEQHDDEPPEVDALGRTLSACIWFALIHDTHNVHGDSSFFNEQLPRATDFVPKRKIDLHPFELIGNFVSEHRYYAPSALNSLAVALNSGDHVILTGPPGSGKTELATQLPKKLNPPQPYLLCTASPDWTTNELIGRYMPTIRQGDKSVLEFEPGFFLEAIRDGQWLIIDELNRADIDSCMGPLFSVLSGHEVILPYKTLERYSDESVDDSSDESVGANSDEGTTVSEDSSRCSSINEHDVESATEKRIEILEKNFKEFDASLRKSDGRERDCTTGNARRVGICAEKDFPKLKEECGQDVFWYKVPDDFRIICTMNDSDAGMLNQLSYALQRRFSVIRIEAPEASVVGDFIEQACVDVFERYIEAGRCFPGYANRYSRDGKEKKKYSQVRDDYLKKISTQLKRLFGMENQMKDLMQLRVVGFGQVADIITMVIEGLSCPPGYQFSYSSREDSESDLQGLILTLLANGVVMKVFPQLPAFICNRDEDEIEEVFQPALKCIATVFVSQMYYELKAKTRPKTKSRDETAGKTIEIKPVETEPTLLENYLEKELKLLFRNQHVEWQKYWKGATQSNEESNGELPQNTKNPMKIGKSKKKFQRIAG